ncbi:MAG: hypothetical protein HRT95_18855, partial [Moritella sp.]|uniref:reverse transcriptase family protein n=1 Tax=Moritella sp. TaxID=78556 RepID=UPI001DB61042|nr:hypothetical protein [Moritella sp.]
MIDISLYRARIGTHALCRHKKTKKIDYKGKYCKYTGSIDYNFNSMLAWAIYFVLVLYFTAISLSLTLETRLTNLGLCGIESLKSTLPAHSQFLKTALSIFLFKFLFYVVISSNHNFKKRHQRICLYLGYILSLLNFLLITIVNPSLLNPGPNRSFDVYYQNIRGFLQLKDVGDANPSLDMTKLLEFQSFVFANKPKVIALNETWLKPSIHDGEILPSNDYNIFRVDRSEQSHPPDRNNSLRFRRNGGGVLIAVRSDLDVSCKIVKLNCNAEILTIEITTNNRQKLYFCTCYRVGTLGATNAQEIDNYLRSLIARDRKFVRILIVGDFNLAEMNWESNYSPCTIEQQFINSFGDLGLNQLVKDPTHGLGNTLDLLLTNSEQSISNLKVHDKDSMVHSDHFPISFDINLSVKKKKSIKRKVFNFKRANWVDLDNDIRHVDWNSLLLGKPIEVAWDLFKVKLDYLCHKHIPVISIKSEFQPPWFDSDCYNLCREKERWRTKFKRSKNDEHYLKFSKCRRDFKKLVQHKMRDNLFPENDNSSITKKFWSHVKSVSNSHRIPESVYFNGRFRSSKKDQADLFNEYFYKQFSDSSSYDINIDYTNDPLNNFNIEHTRVRKLLQKLNSNKAVGPDKIHGKVLKECAVGLAYPLSILFNTGLRSGSIPHDWKTANVVPIHKKGCKSNVENYRPISLTSLVMKVFENIIRDEIYSKCSHLIDPRQHGFLPSRSCNTQLVDFCDSLTVSLINNQDSDVIYFDFAKAFDSVNHDILLNKLKTTFGIDGILLKFLVSYLRGRVQRVVIGNSESSLLDVLSGVPQGSILGPLLFVLFINDLPEGLSEHTSIGMYADDTKIWRQINSLEDCFALQSDIDYLQNWAFRNKMNFHPNKCKVLNISLRYSSLFTSAL